MTSLMTPQRDVKFALLYSCLTDIVTFSAIQVVVFNQSYSNFTHICSLVQHIGLYFFYVKRQTNRSWGQKVGQILK